MKGTARLCEQNPLASWQGLGSIPKAGAGTGFLRYLRGVATAGGDAA